MNLTGHQHLANNESSTEPLVLVVAWVNIPKGKAVPVFENELDNYKRCPPPDGCIRAGVVPVEKNMK